MADEVKTESAPETSPARAIADDVIAQNKSIESAAPEVSQESTQETPKETPQQASFRKIFQEKFGGQVFPDDVDDARAAELLAETLRKTSGQLQQVRQMEPQLAEYQRHQAEFQKFLASQQQQAPAETPWEKKFWDPPQFDPANLARLGKDEAGNIVLKDLADDPSLISQYKNYENYVRSWQQKWARNPVETLKPMVESMAQQVAEKLFTDRMAKMQEQQMAQQFEETRPWLYERDAQGQPLVDPLSREKVYSKWGKLTKEIIDREVVRQQQTYGRTNMKEIIDRADMEVQLQYYKSQDYAQEILKKHKPEEPEEPAAPVQTGREKANEEFLKKTSKPAARKADLTPASAKQMTDRQLAENLVRSMG